MSQIDIRQVSADDHAAWLPLWQAYLRFYNTELPDAVTRQHLAALSRPERTDPRGIGLGRR